MEVTVAKNIVTITFDATKRLGISKSRKSLNVAGSNGAIDVPGFPGLKLSLNAYKKATAKDLAEFPADEVADA